MFVFVLFIFVSFYRFWSGTVPGMGAIIHTATPTSSVS